MSTNNHWNWWVFILQYCVWPTSAIDLKSLIFVKRKWDVCAYYDVVWNHHGIINWLYFFALEDFGEIIYEKSIIRGDNKTGLSQSKFIHLRQQSYTLSSSLCAVSLRSLPLVSPFSTFLYPALKSSGVPQNGVSSNRFLPLGWFHQESWKIRKH